jgi:hypothetical protein
MQFRLAKEEKGWRLMVSPDGINERPVGPLWPTPKEASAFYDLTVGIPYVSPLRSPLRAEPMDAPPSSSTLPEAANASRVPARTTEYPARRVVPKPDQGHGDKTGSSGGDLPETESELRFAFGDR